MLTTGCCKRTCQSLRHSTRHASPLMRTSPGWMMMIRPLTAPTSAPASSRTLRGPQVMTVGLAVAPSARLKAPSCLWAWVHRASRASPSGVAVLGAQLALTTLPRAWASRPPRHHLQSSRQSGIDKTQDCVDLVDSFTKGTLGRQTTAFMSLRFEHTETKHGLDWYYGPHKHFFTFSTGIFFTNSFVNL